MTQDLFVEQLDKITYIDKVTSIYDNTFLVYLTNNSIPNGTLKQIAELMCKVYYAALKVNESQQLFIYVELKETEK